MAPAGIIWDVDGTLCDILPLCLAAFRTVFARHLGREFSDAETLAGFGATEAGTIRALIPEAREATEEEYRSPNTPVVTGSSPRSSSPACWRCWGYE